PLFRSRRAGPPDQPADATPAAARGVPDRSGPDSSPVYRPSMPFHHPTVGVPAMTDHVGGRLRIYPTGACDGTAEPRQLTAVNQQAPPLRQECGSGSGTTVPAKNSAWRPVAIPATPPAPAAEHRPQAHIPDTGTGGGRRAGEPTCAAHRRRTRPPPRSTDARSTRTASARPGR